MTEEYAHARFPDGVWRQFVLGSKPRQAVCAGDGGTCRMPFDWRDPMYRNEAMGAFCPACRLGLNLRAMVRRIERGEPLVSGGAGRDQPGAHVAPERQLTP